VYLQSGRCMSNKTACWSHPGTYMDQLGFIIGKDKIKVLAGSYSEGMQVWLNDVPVMSGSNKHNSSLLSFPSVDQLTVRSDLFVVTAKNSDYFFNLEVRLLDEDLLRAGSLRTEVEGNSGAQVSQLYPDAPIHGLIGQTWKNVVYSDDVLIEGEIDDYMIGSRSLFDTQFVFSRFD